MPQPPPPPLAIPFALIAYGLFPEERAERIQDAEARLAQGAGVEGQSEIAALSDLGDLYWASGDFAAALERRERALVYARRLYGTDAPETLEQMVRVADLYEIFARYDAAEAFARFALDRLPTGNGATGTRISCLAHLGGICRVRARYGEAETLFREALTAATELLGPGHPTTAQIAYQLAVTLDALKVYGLLPGEKAAEANALVEYAVETLGQTLGETHPETIHVRWAAHQNRGDAKESPRLIEQVLAALQERLGPNHLLALSALEVWADSVADADEKAAHYERVLRAREAAFGPDHPHAGISLNHLAQVRMEQNRLVEAEQLSRRVVAIEKAAHGTLPTTAYQMIRLGAILTQQGRLAEAEPLFQQAVDIYEHFGIERYLPLAEALTHLANCYRARGQRKAADSLFRWALLILEQLGKGDGMETAYALRLMAINLSEQNREDDAEQTYYRSLRMLETLYGRESTQLLVVLRDLGRLHTKRQQFARAEAVITRTIALLEREQPPTGPFLDEALSDLATAYVYSGRLPEAAAAFRRAFERSEARRGLLDAHTAQTAANLAATLDRLGRRAEAVEMRYLARRIQESIGAG